MNSHSTQLVEQAFRLCTVDSYALCTDQAAFIQADLAGQHIIIDCSHSQVDAYMQHYQRCKRDHPLTTSACFLVPSDRGPWKKYLPNLTKVMTFKAGTSLYTNPSTGLSMGPTLYSTDVYYDPPAPRMKCAAFNKDKESLDMIFACKLAGVEVDVLVDSRATHSFIDLTFAEEHGIAMSSDSGVVFCGGDTVAKVSGSAKLSFKLGKYQERLRFYACKYPRDHPVILGNGWVKSHLGNLL